MIQSVAGQLAEGALSDRRPFRAPHHSASMAALVGGGINARPGEVSLAHHGVLFLDELPEFQPQVLDSLRQPLETGEVLIARANHRVTYPARFQLVAAMNPCRCGQAMEPGYRLPPAAERALHRAIPVPALRAAARPHRSRHRRAGGHGRRSHPAAADGRLGGGRGARRRSARAARPRATPPSGCRGVATNAACPAPLLEEVAEPDGDGLTLIRDAAEAMRLSARGFHRVLKVARTLADLDGEERVRRIHLAEALSYRAHGDRKPAAA